tara:strand:+ start:4620 stop:7406 length:2787 start_codon:yes stop_codon:yes gene_type:complete
MKFLSCRLAAVTLLFLLGIANSQITGDLKIAFLRVSFNAEDFPGFTGDGDFLLTPSDICGNYIVDPPPHDRNYFSSHIVAVDNYFRAISYNKFGLDLNASSIFPLANESSYKLDKSMNYYNELGMDDEHEYRITLLLKDAIDKAYQVDQIDFNNFDLVAIIHPGLGQDFKLPFLDPTPEDIPSTFIDKEMVVKHLNGPIVTGTASVEQGIILPESQNHPLMDSSIYDVLTEPCDLQYSITGTWALMIGFAVGLPPMWNIESGKSGIGIFGLMDQGSNNGRGITPAIPNPWTRIYAGWEEPKIYKKPQKVYLSSAEKNSIAKIPINDTEYFLIENRNNWYREEVSIDSARLKVWELTGSYPNYINILFDSTGIVKNEYGVVTDIDNYSIGLPASGLLFWHIDEKIISDKISSYQINAEIELKGVDLEEADGAQDIGYISNLLTDPSSGYWGDMWFRENNQYFRSNTSDQLEFSSYTFPNTHSNNNYVSGIHINNISETDTIMSFDLNSSYDVDFFDVKNKSILFQWDIDQDGRLEFIGSGDSLWWSNNLNQLNTFKENFTDNIQFCIVKNSNPTAFVVVEKIYRAYNIFWYEYDDKIKNFLLLWDRRLESNAGAIDLLGAVQKSIFYKRGAVFFQIDENGYNKIDYPKDLLSFSATNSSQIFYTDQVLKTNNGQSSLSADFRSFSLVDLDLDDRVDIIAVDQIGNIHAFDENLYYKNGFPLKVSAIGTVLAMDLLNDTYPEIVFEQSDKSLIIANHEGLIQQSLSLNIDSKLSSLGVHQNKNSLILTDQILMYKDSQNDQNNRWVYKYGSPDYSRFLDLDTLDINLTNQGLLDKSLTYAYPNPSYGENIIFRLKIGSIEAINIDIYDLAGFLKESISSTIKNNIKNSSSSIIEIPWKIQNVESGVYLARIRVINKNSIEEKIIKVGIIK